MGISENIKRIREEHGMTQAEFAEIVGATDKAVSTWENGSAIPRMGKIEKISQYFNIPKSAIIGDPIDRARNRQLERYEKFDSLLTLIEKLDDVDRARLEERARMMLEDTKYVD